MMIMLSAKVEGQGRHVVARVPIPQDFQVQGMMQRIVGRNTSLIREVDRRENRVTYRFHLRFLDKILLAFPMADMSRGLQKRQIRIGRREIEQMEVPELDLPGFQVHDPITRLPVELYGFQKIAVGKQVDALLLGERTLGAEEVVGFLNNDGLGLGKTNMALGTVAGMANEVFSVLVVVPNNAKTVWQRHVSLNTDLECLVVDGPAVAREMLIEQRAEVTIVNFESIRAKWDKLNPETGRDFARKEDWTFEPKHASLFDHEYDLIIVDEYHRVKNTKAQQTIGYLALRAKRWLCMSGTPILSRPEEAWPTLHRIWPEKYPSEYLFTSRMATRSEGQIVAYDPDFMAELREHLASNSIRRRKEQVMDQLPQTIIATRNVTLTAEQRRIYNQIRDDFLLELDDGERKSITTYLAQLGRLKQACLTPELFGGSQHSAKIDELKEVVRELLDAGEKAIVYSQWAKATRIFSREFEDVRHAYVDGTVTDRPGRMRRTEQQDLFNLDDECRLYIGTIGANREAISLPAATYVIFTDKAWTPAENQQAADRSASGGLRGLHSGVATVTRVELIAEDTVEVGIEDMLARKQALFNAMVERDGGQRITRSTLNDIRDLVRAA